MKNIIIITIKIFSAFNLFAQTGGVEVHAKSNCSQSNNQVLVVDIFIQAEDATEDIYIAEQNYRFDYNDAALANPALLTTESDLNFGKPIILPGGSIILYSAAAFDSLENDVSVSTELLSASGIQLSSTTPVYICSVQFDVLDATLPVNFNWHDPTEFPATFLSSNNGGLPAEVPAIFYDDLQTTVQDNFGCLELKSCLQMISHLSDTHIECGDEDGGTIVLEVGNPDDVILESKPLSFWIDNPDFPQFYHNKDDGYYYFEQLSAFEFNMRDGNCNATIDIVITEEACRLKTAGAINFVAYPNPANQLLRVDIAGNIVESSTVSIYDVTGKQVQATALMPQQNSIQLNVEDLTNGIYLIEVNTGDDKIYTQKLTIAH